jgi:hypothetical protein
MPEKKGGGPADGEAPVLHAVSTLFMGDKDLLGMERYDAWEYIGFNLDGSYSTAKDKKHCKPIFGARPQDIRQDGYGGIDNSFSKNLVLGMFSALITDVSSTSTELIQRGGRTLLLDMGPLGAKENYETTGGQIFEVRGALSLDGSALPEDWTHSPWHPLKETLGKDGSPRLVLEDSYLSDNTWAARGRGVLTLALSADGIPLEVTLHNPLLKVDVTERSHGKNGILGGILSPEELNASFRQIGGFLGNQFCGDSPALEGIQAAIFQAADILMDGTQDPEKPCEGISAGIGFLTRQTQMGPPKPSIPLADPCAP